MNDSVEEMRWLSVRNIGIGAVILFTILIVAALWLIFGRHSQNQLMPVLPSPTIPPIPLAEEPENLTFSELNDNPLAYQDQSIIVSGNFLPVDKVNCNRVSGPDIRWSLTADNLQLDVLGFERIIKLLSPETPMTIQGMWRLYQGPLGCGKAPPRGSMWYLDVQKIVRPNPLVGAGSRSITVQIRPGDSGFPSLVPTQPPLDLQPTAAPTPEATAAAGTIMPSPTISEQTIPTETPLLPGDVTPSATTPLTTTPVEPTNTPDPMATDPSSTAGATAAATENPGNNTPTITAEAPPIPATATETGNGGYPGPDATSTPTATATIDPYP